MPTVLPQSVRDAIGEEASNDFVLWYDEKSVQREEYRQVLSRLDVIEHDLKSIHARLDRIETRMDQMASQTDNRFDGVNNRFDGVNDRFDRLHEAMRVQTRWTVGTIALFGTLITVLLAIAEFTS